jgi:hypothetical protein
MPRSEFTVLAVVATVKPCALRVHTCYISERLKFAVRYAREAGNTVKHTLHFR